MLIFWGQNCSENQIAGANFVSSAEEISYFILPISSVFSIFKEPKHVSVNYQKLINKYIPVDSVLSHIYLTHVTLVTNRALEIGRRLGMGTDQLRFIEEAAMLHDIGVIYVNAPEIGCSGDLPYIQHIIKGKEMLLAEGLPDHARVAENHIGMGGLAMEEILRKELPLPARDMLCEKLEDKVISYADLFYSKNPARLWIPKTHKQAKAKVEKLGKRQEKLYDKLRKDFGEGI